MKFPRTQKTDALDFFFFFFRMTQSVTKLQTDLLHSRRAQAMYNKSLYTTQKKKEENQPIRVSKEVKSEI